MPEQNRKTVLIIGGGVAALSAAAALVESNGCNNPVEFSVHILTDSRRWGGRASSWPGGWREPNNPWSDLTMWPDDCLLNHGFHSVFDESTYTNFWPTFSKPYPAPPHDPYSGLRSKLCSNRHEFLIYENALMRMSNEGGLWTDIKNAYELVRGGWTFPEILSFRDVLYGELSRYGTFQQLQEVDRYANDEFGQWCLGRGLEPAVLEKQLFEFISDGTYVAPCKIDTASAIRGLWTFARDYDASEWFYIEGGITQQIMNPLADYLHRHGVRWTMLSTLDKFFANRPERVLEGHRANQRPNVVERSGGPNGQEEERHVGLSVPLPERFDYYISTLLLDDLYTVLESSGILDDFPNIQELSRNPTNCEDVTAATVNLQVWFQERVIPDDIRNVVAGLEPLCVLIDYKNLLRYYRDDGLWPGSVLEINGAAEELRRMYPDRFRIGPPNDPRTIDFARTIMLDIARRYPEFSRLGAAVRNNNFLSRPDWPGRTRWNGNGDRIPPFLWINHVSQNGFFVTAPGLLHLRPTIVTPYANLFFAGDWTRNGFDVPSMESAARSGRMAALEILRRENCPDLIGVFDPY